MDDVGRVENTGLKPIDEVEKQYIELEAKVKSYNPNLNTARMRAAYEYARKMHGEQKRKDDSRCRKSQR